MAEIAQETRLDTRPAAIADEVRGIIKRDALESLEAEEILSWAVGKFHPRMSLSASFGAPEGMVLLHMLHRIEPSTRVFVLDTGRLHPATYDLIDRIRDRYDKRVEVVFPDPVEIQEMVQEKGMNLFYESLDNRQLCCNLRKVAPMRRYLGDIDAYVTGLRRDQNVTRADTPKIQIDANHGDVVKLNPIADWNRERVMAYVGEFNIPINRLHGKGFPSVGCEPCTRAIGPGDDPRAGRWWWESPESRECGLHVADQAGGSGI